MAQSAAPRVAVVIPCFNDGGTVGEAIDSALAQDEPVELVVVDDGSTDADTRASLAELAASGVTVVRQANAGPGAARRAGLERTSAPYVLPLDADDVLVAGALRELVAVLDAHPRAAAAWGSFQRFGAESTLQRTARCLDGWLLTYLNDLPATALFRRAALVDADGWATEGGYEDWDLWMRLAERGWEGVGLRRVVYRYRRQGTRRAHRDLARHGETVELLLARHPRLRAARRRNWRRSCSPLAVRLALPLLAALPLAPDRRRVLGGVVNHLAQRRGIRVLVRRAREQG